MEKKKGIFSWLKPKLEPLEVYMLAAENPVGKRQLRPVFRRRRSRVVLTREQVTAIKRGRRVLRKDMKERGLKRWSDFDETATSLGLYFDRRGLALIIPWFLGGSTALKILATTVVVTMLVTVFEPVTEYVTQYMTEYVTEYVTEFQDKDRFTINLSDELLNTGFELSETPGFENPQQTLFSVPVTRVPCVSITQIPHDVAQIPNNTVKEYFTYSFYCRYINKNAEADTAGDLSKYAVNYDWGIRKHIEGLNTTAPTTGPSDPTAAQSGVQVSDAIWLIVIRDDEVIIAAKAEKDEEGNLIPQMIPTQKVLESQRVAFKDRSMDYINLGLARIHPDITVDTVGDLESLFGAQANQYEAQVNAYFDAEGIQPLTRLMLKTADWKSHYKEVGSYDNYSYYQVIAEEFKSDDVLVERTVEGVLPWIKDRNEEVHKYTVVIWLEGDDPQCTNELMDGHIGLNFQIKGENEEYVDAIITPTVPTEPTS